MPTKFDEIMDFATGNRGNYAQLVRTLRDKTQKTWVVPFVGAGLSVPFGGKNWESLVQAICADTVNSQDVKDEVKKLLDEKNTIEAVGLIRGEVDDNNLNNALKRYIPNSTRCKSAFDSALSRSAARFLPHLFSNGVITTNYDDVLEYAYNAEGHSFPNGHVLIPADTVESFNGIQTSAHVLFKVHGSVNELFDYNKIVLDADQYDRHYGDGSKLVTQLTLQFSSSIFLFLGCSLQQDRTVELFKRISGELHGGMKHFAIVSYGGSKEDMDERVRTLTEMNIFPILYKDGEHDSVRKILRQLLRDVYPNSPALNEKRRSSSPFRYDAETTDFLGRDDEVRRLQAFFDSESDFCWWAVTGAGGTGKSRLCYEFGHIMEAQGKRVYFLNDKRYNQIEDYEFYENHISSGSDILMVADYVYQHIGALGELIKQLYSKEPPCKCRLLLVERSGKSVDDAPWLSFETDAYKKHRFKVCAYQNDFLTLEPIAPEAIREIMQSYVESQYLTEKPDGLSQSAAEVLINKLQEIDSRLQRPLYGLFLADAWAQGKGITDWSRINTLDYVCSKERQYVIEAVKKCSGEDKAEKHLALINAVCELRAYATVRGGITVEEIPPYLNEVLSECAEKLRSVKMSVKTMLKELRYLETGDGKERIEPIHPDLVGEYYTWLYLPDAVMGFDPHSVVYADGWHENKDNIEFVARAISDFKELCGGNRDEIEYLGALALGKNDASFAFRCAYVLFRLTYLLSNAEKCKKATDELKRAHDKYPSDGDIALRYAEGLTNLTAVQDTADECKETTDKLYGLYDKPQSDIAIALAYAKGLFNLTYVQDTADECKETTDKLYCLYEKSHSGIAIALEYAKGLVSLTYVQDTANECKETTDKLYGLYEKSGGNAEFALRYAKGLVNLTYVQDTANECKETTDKLGVLHEKSRGNADITLAYAQGLVNLTCVQDTADERKETTEKLCGLHDRFPSDAEIALRYTQGLYNLRNKQTSPDDIAETTEKIEALCSRFPEVEEFMRPYQ